MKQQKENAGQETLNNQALLFHLQGNLKMARNLFENALAIEPDNAAVHNNLGFLLCQQNNWDEAMVHLEKAVTLHPESDAAHLNKGHAHLAQGAWGQAYAHYSKALEINQENPLAWESYAKFFMLNQQPGDAAQAWAQAVQLKPEELGYQLELAVCLVALGHYPDAKIILEEVIRRDARQARAWAQLGIVYFLRKDYGIAEELLTKALGLAPEDESARYHLALTCLTTGEQAKAEQEFQRLVQLHPANAKARTDLAVLLLSRGELETALLELNTCLSTNPDYAKAKYYQAVILHQMNRAAEAEPILESLAVDPAADYAQQGQVYLEKYFHA